MTTSRNENHQRRINLPIFGQIPIRDLSLAAGLVVGALGVLLTVVSIYLTLREPEARVTFKINSATDVLDLRRSLDDLRIEFRGQDLQEQNLNLKVVKLSVENSGETHIRAGDYGNADWGIKIIGGQIIEAKVDRSDTVELISTNELRYVGSDSIGFPKIVLDKGDAFAIELLVLHSNRVEPVVEPIGKIAGIKDFDIAPPPIPGEEVGFVGETFRGSIRILSVRSVVYFVGSIIVFFIAIFGLAGSEALIDIWKKRRRRRRALQTTSVHEIELVRDRDGLVALFATHGIMGLRLLYEFTQHPNWLVWIDATDRWMDIPKRGDADFQTSVYQSLEAQNFSNRIRITNAVLHVPIFQKGDGENPVIDPTLVQAVENLIAELED